MFYFFSNLYKSKKGRIEVFSCAVLDINPIFQLDKNLKHAGTFKNVSLKTGAEQTYVKVESLLLENQV